MQTAKRGTASRSIVQTMAVTLWSSAPSINECLLHGKTQLLSLSLIIPSSSASDLYPSTSPYPSYCKLIQNSKRISSYSSITSSLNLYPTPSSFEVGADITVSRRPHNKHHQFSSNLRSLNMPPQPVDQEKCIYCGNYFAEYQCGCQKPESSINRK